MKKRNFNLTRIAGGGGRTISILRNLYIEIIFLAEQKIIKIASHKYDLLFLCINFKVRRR